MISSEVQRTLVKSPPELWAEISDPESLARHLGEFGEIRITRVQPEQKVEWEATDATGTVAIKPSGWGTKVRLTVTRRLAELEPPAEDTTEAQAPASDRTPEEPDAIPEPGPAPEVEVTSEPVGALAQDSAPEPGPSAVEPGPSAAEPGPSAAEPGPSLEGEPPEGEGPTPEPRPAAAQNVASGEPSAKRGFFARMFRRRAKRGVVAEDAKPPADEPATDFEPAAESESAPEAEPPTEAGTGTETKDELECSAPPEGVLAESAEGIGAAEEAAAEQATAVLTSVLDRLGAAHHRPFSRG